jgi:pyruvate formate-lyase/glycerol dehydratase family glycyl radical enzyme
MNSDGPRGDESREERDQVSTCTTTPRITALKDHMQAEARFMSIEQALIVTQSYREHPDESRVLQRARAFDRALREITIRIDPDELIVGNRTAGVRAGVVFPESGISWVGDELDTLPTREQDRFGVKPEDAASFREGIVPFWSGKTLEDIVAERHGTDIGAVKKVVKINQTDHAQGHICPNVEKWLATGPAGLKQQATDRRGHADPDHRPFYEAVVITLDGIQHFMRRYAALAREMAATADADAADGIGKNHAETLTEVARICEALAQRAPQTLGEALQSVWFLFVGLQMESNASSFSPGRLDQYLEPFLTRDLAESRLSLQEAQELLDALWIKFNQIVYMRNASSAQYFAGFPIGFNVAVGGMNRDGDDATNLLSYMCLKAQEHIGLPQPNLTARLWSGSPDSFVDECARIIGLGSGMPQIVSDDSIIPSLCSRGIDPGDARDYAVVGCVELSTQGNELGWSDAAMFNMVKALELTLNDGRCLLTGDQLGPKTGTLADLGTFGEFETAFGRQVDYFVDRMIPLCDALDRLHAEVLPSPFLSSVIDDCLATGIDVTAGGAHYNLSGIQAIQVANVADSLAALKALVYDAPVVSPDELLEAIRHDFDGEESLRQKLVQQAPKYGNDVRWVDEFGERWAHHFANRLTEFTNARGGAYHMGLYTVSAHVPMGKNVGATPDGRKARAPLADGGMSAVYGRDMSGPTALLQSVSRVNSRYASNGTLLNMKFLPRTFRNAEERGKFVSLLRAFVGMGIHHVQFNVVDHKTLMAAKENPEEYGNLTIRVAGYTAYFVELAPDLQDEIIARTAYGA